jgi:magnesium-protoporphyrin O-methyltransferase
MSDCCSPKGYRWIFSERNARSEAKRYRRKGLDPTSRRIFDYLKQRGVEGRTVLEVGGGIGAIQIELLKAGATRAVSVELTPTYEQAAGELLKEAGLADRVERRVMDFARSGDEVEPADIVIMNRVICCYPDMPLLAGSAADHSAEVLVMSFPKERWWTRLMLTLGNFVLRVMQRQFQVFVHPPEKILAEAERHGLHTALDAPGLFWEVAAAQRAAVSPPNV